MEQFAYLIRSIQLSDIEEVIRKAKQSVAAQADILYHQLLAREIEAVVDDIALNICRRPEKQSILQAARSVLDNKIHYAVIKQAASMYNFQVYVHLLSCGKMTYIQFGAAFSQFHESLDGVAGLEPLDDDPNSTDFQQISKLLEKLRETEPPLGIPIYTDAVTRKAIDLSVLSFAPPSARAEAIARHTMSNRLLENMACGREIQNYQLMRYMDAVFEQLDQPQIQKEIVRIQQQLARLLPVITAEMISSCPATAEQPKQGG